MCTHTHTHTHTHKHTHTHTHTCKHTRTTHTHIHAGADSVRPDVLAAVSDQERKRQEAIFELLSSERNYVDSLKLVKEVSYLQLPL